ncbi:MAG: alpha/beta hydrolase [Pseudomonadota bacterium]
MKNFLMQCLIWLFSVVCLVLIVVFAASPKQTPEITDEKGEVLDDGIAEIRDIDLNGVKQRVLVRGQNRDNPILLHLHGGPGGTDQMVMRHSNLHLEDLFTVVYWDQRGSGASYHKTMSMEDLSLDNIVNDGVTLAKLLLEEFDQDKLYLQGHSWGTFVGVHMVAEAPELFYAYFSIGQVADSKRAEKLSWEFAMNAAKRAGDQKTIDGLNKIGSPPYNSEQEWLKTATKERALMRPYEMPDGSQFISMFETYKLATFYPEYSVPDKLNALAGTSKSLQKLWGVVINANLFETHPAIDVPLYMVQGKYDQHTVTEVAKDYFDFVQAPYKEYLSFDESAHWPHLNEPEKYRALLERVLVKNE